MTRSNDPDIGGVAADIRRRLEQAQAVQGGPATAPPENTNADTARNATRVTKDGRLIPAGEDVPRDSAGNPVPHSVLPDATFHFERNTP